MAYKNHHAFLFPQLLVLALTLLLVVAVAEAAGRDIPTQNTNDNVKQPQWLFGHDGSFLIPGIGRVMAPPKLQPHFPSYPPQYGRTGGGSHIPGGDDNPIPNPGVEVPNPNPVGGANPSPP